MFWRRPWSVLVVLIHFWKSDLTCNWIYVNLLDRIFGDQNSTFELYMEFAMPIVLSVMEGINGNL